MAVLRRASTRLPILGRASCNPSKPKRVDSSQYHSSNSPPTSPYSQVESTILYSALRHVPEHGFTATSLSKGAKDSGYLDVSVNLFPRGVFELVNYHLVTQRLALKEAVQFPDEKLGVGVKVRALALARLRANGHIVGKWQEAIALMAVPSNVSTSLAELARLADEIWYLAGDTSVDTSWYTKRATLSAVYSSTELFMTSDNSPNFVETEEFLDRRLEELGTIGSNLGAVGQWAKFSAQSAVNVLRSKGMRI